MSGRLVAISAEVRLKILKQLLYIEVGFQIMAKRGMRNTPSRLHPAILSCCRQLYEEGMPILRSNLLHINIGVQGYSDPLEYNSRPLPRGLCKIHVTISIGNSPNEDPHSEMRDFERVYNAAAAVKTHGKCVDLRVYLGEVDEENATNVDFADSSATESELEAYMRPFSLLCRLEHVEFVGAAPREFADKLTKEMLGETPVADLPAMYGSLATWLWRNKGQHDIPLGEHFWDDALWEAEYAAFRMDVEDFCRRRKQVIEAFDQTFNASRMDIYINNPNPHNARYHALTNDIKQAVAERDLLDMSKVDNAQSDSE
jgi:hypothetical protein